MSEAAQLLQNRKEQLTIELKRNEKMIHDLETAYLSAEYTHMGSVLKGLEGFLSAKDALKRGRVRTYKLEDRLFSLSSKSSLATEELERQEAALEELNGPTLGRGKGKGNPFASKGMATKGRR